MSKPVLHYFDLFARAETSRMILRYNRTVFEDMRYDRDEWFSKHKFSGKFEFEKLPMLEIDGHRLVQSRCIERYLCQKFGFYPKDLFEIYQVESIAALKEDIELQFVKYNRILNDPQGWANWLKNEMPNCLKMIEGRLQGKKASNFFVGNSVSLADFVVFEYVYDSFMRPSVRDERLKMLEDAAPKLKDYAENFLDKSRELKEYLKNRPEKPV